MTLLRGAFLSLIGDAGASEADKRYHAAQKDIHLAVSGKFIKNTLR